MKEHGSDDETLSHIDAILRHPLLAQNRFPWSEAAYIDIVAISWSHKHHTRMIIDSRMKGRLDALLTRIEKAEIQWAQLTCGSLKELLFFSLLKPCLPCHVVSRIIRITLQFLCQSLMTQKECVASYVSLALYWVQQQNTPMQNDEVSSSVPLDASLETWKVLVEHCGAQDYDGSLKELLEAHLSQAMAAGGNKDASLLYSLLLQLSPSETIRLCLRSKWLSTQQKSQIIASPQLSTLLSSVIASDPIVFGTSFLVHLVGMKEEDGSICMLEKGVFDEEIATLSKYTKLLMADCFAKIRHPIVERALTALFAKTEVDNKRRHIEDGLVLFLSTPGILQNAHFETCIDRLSNLLHSMDRRDIANNKWLRLSYALLCTQNPEMTLHPKIKLDSLSSIILARALDALQLSVKSHFRSSGPQSWRVSGQPCLAAFDRITDLIIKMRDCEGKVFTPEGPRAMTGAIKACLKHGMAHAVDEDCRISERCLRFIRFLLVELSDPLSSLRKLMRDCVLLDPSTILALVLSHSQFHAVMTGLVAEDDRSNNDGAVLELVRILLVCTWLSRNEVLFDTEVWATLLSAYNAGMSLVDITLRRLFYVYAEALAARDKVNVMGAKLCQSPSYLLTSSSRTQTSKIPLMENFRWKGMPRADHAPEDGNTKSSCWEWLANGLEIARVQATLCRFPVHDRVKADAIRNVEVWLKAPEEIPIHGDGKESNSDDSSSGNSHEPVEEDSEGVVETDRGYKYITDNDKWIESEAGLRYSPAFILPVILGALETSLCRDGSSMNTLEKGVSRDESLGYVEEGDESLLREFALVAQRLCDKGALSLALGALCSNCSSLRKVAVAILGHIKMALDSRVARNLSSWRERPQLLMIVNSVQRGMAVSAALQSDPNEAPSRQLVPKLPALAAIFLGRAALIIVKPGDSMFGQMNRYFLRLENGHGAFQDTNRLPIFISLFCSSSDEPGQAPRERRWALQLLNDSFVEEYSYRMVASCHAPELLLTSFSSMLTRQKDDQPEIERTLLLSAITILLHYGGSRATSHLIGRLGLLSWIRGQIVTGTNFDLLPTLESRTAFLRLISKALQKAYLFLADEKSVRDYLLTESIALINPVLFLYDGSIRRGLVSTHFTSTTNSFAAAACETLQTLVRLTKVLQSNVDIGKVHRHGVSIALASTLLQTIPTVLTKMAVWSLCMAPMCGEVQLSSGASLFIKSILSYLATSESDAETMSAALERVSLVASTHKRSFDLDVEILDDLLACRSKCLPLFREDWFRCLKALVDETDSSPSSFSSSDESADESEELLVAKAILVSNTPRTRMIDTK